MKKKKEMPKIGKKKVKSQFEFDVYKKLKNSLPRGAMISYETDLLDYILTKNYLPDFTIELKDGTIIYIEAKGLGRAFDYNARIKMEAVKERHPDKDIRIVFMSDRPFRKGGKMRPTDWAQKNGFPCAVGEVPKEWFNNE